MAMNIDGVGVAPDRDNRREAFEFRLIYLIAFTVFLGAALLMRVLPWRWRLFGGPGTDGKSVFRQARDLANGSVPYAFML